MLNSMETRGATSQKSKGALTANFGGYWPHGHPKTSDFFFGGGQTLGNPARGATLSSRVCVSDGDAILDTLRLKKNIAVLFPDGIEPTLRMEKFRRKVYLDSDKEETQSLISDEVINLGNRFSSLSVSPPIKVLTFLHASIPF